MATSSDHLRTLLDKLDQLPPSQLAEVEDFVDFLRYKDQDRRLTQAATHAAQPSFTQVWDNPDDASMTRCEFGDVVLVPFPPTRQ